VTLRNASGQQTGARHGTGRRRRVEAGEPGTFPGEPVKVRCLDGRIAVVNSQISVDEIVGRDDQDVRLDVVRRPRRLALVSSHGGSNRQGEDFYIP